MHDDLILEAGHIGDSYGSDGRPLADAVADVERDIRRAMSADERALFNLGWHVGRADYEARVEREAAKKQAVVSEPVYDEPIPF